MITWNPWHGCKKISPGCLNCYMYRQDAKIGRDSTRVVLTKDYYLPLKRNRNKVYKITCLQSPVYVCMTSDFFIEEADAWRNGIWKIMRYRSDLHYKIITKRPERISQCLPSDWWGGYKNVTIICTCENQDTADRRLPILLSLPVRHREIIHEPMLERIDIEKYLATGLFEAVTCGGESGVNARPCDYGWILDTREQCIRNNVSFFFKQTGACFIKDGKQYSIERHLQMQQAKRAGIDFKRVQEKQYDPYEDVFIELANSVFYSSFHLCPKAREYCCKAGFSELQHQAFDAVRELLAKAYYPNDGEQTPKTWEPIYTAMRATAASSRKSLEAWHGIPRGKKLNENEIIYIAGLIMHWIAKQLNDGAETQLSFSGYDNKDKNDPVNS